MKIAADSAELFMPDDKSTAESTSSWGVVDLDNIEEEGDAIQFLKQYSSSEHVWCESESTLFIQLLLDFSKYDSV
jgi:1-phosphatidylinositol-3-phosphate 5-kinase